MKSSNSGFTTRTYTCACGKQVTIGNIPVSTSGNATCRIECPKCGELLAVIHYTPGDQPPRRIS